MRRKIFLLIGFLFILVGGTYFLYFRTPRVKPISLPPGPFLEKEALLSSEEKKALIQEVHAQLKRCGKKERTAESLPSNISRLHSFLNPYKVRLWHQGKKIFSHATGLEPFESSFPKVLAKLCDEKRVVSVPPDERNKIRMEGAIAYDLQPLKIEDYEKDRANLKKQFGLFGVFDAAKNRWSYPDVFIRKMIPFTKWFRVVCGSSKGEKSCEKIRGKSLFLFHTESFVQTTPQFDFVDLYRWAPEATLNSLMPRELQKRIGFSGDWFDHNINAQGSMTYLYEPFKGKNVKKENNWVRQWMSSWSLLRLTAHLKDPALQEKAEKNLAYNVEKTLKIEENKKIAYVLEKEKASLGSASGALLALVESRRHPERAKLIRYLANFILGLQEESGRFKTFYFPFGKGKEPSPDPSQNYYPGEALMALMSLYEKEPKTYPEIPKRVERAFQYYRDFFKKEPSTAFVPWHSQALSKLYRVAPKKEIADFIFEMNDFLYEATRVETQFQALEKWSEEKNRAGGALMPPRAVNSHGVYLEGMAEALKLAIKLKDPLRVEKYSKAARLWLRNLFQLQFTPEGTFFSTRSEKLIGGLRNTDEDSRIRNDNIQHAVGAFLNLDSSPEGLRKVFQKEPVETSPKNR